MFSYGNSEQFAIGNFFNVHKRGPGDTMNGLVENRRGPRQR
jgi:hypothetical protein